MREGRGRGEGGEREERGRGEGGEREGGEGGEREGGEEREERKGRRGKGGEMERGNVLGHVPFANERFLLCVGDKLYLQPLQRVIEVVKCLQ